ncbi:MAG TPA: NAD(P)H-hydrate dehydratase [Luteimonas sp.]|nr:NAD(P)H-hydrate dehydratase [Luteimonas sp.]
MPAKGAGSLGRKVTASALRAWPLPDPSGSGSKEDRGRVLVVGGTREIPGAALLAGIAALRAGAGKLQVATVAEVAVPMAIALPEARVIGLRSGARGGLAALDRATLDCVARAHAVVLGPGMDDDAGTRRVVRQIIGVATGTVVLDAGALHRSALDAARARNGQIELVLTPHLGEMASLLEIDADAIAADLAGTASRFASRWGVVLALKGPVTHIAAADGSLWVNTAGSVGLGTSGSGDVLAGLIGGLAARGARAAQAAVWGVHLHAQAGARLTKRNGLVGFLAREISAEVPGLMQG